VNNSRNLRLHRWEALIRFASVFSLHVFLRAVIIVLFAGMMAGCLPSSQSALDVQNDMHFRKGKALVSALDYTGATESFERALEANPKNSSAHFELGLLYEREGDYSAAIYHFERFLKLRPESEHADIVRSRINTDKMELSKSTLLAPVTQNMQREFEKLAEENKQLRAQLEQARAEVEQWRVHYASQPQSTSTATDDRCEPSTNCSLYCHQPSVDADTYHQAWRYFDLRRQPLWRETGRDYVRESRA
jgi:tetratricopeptide (TPR) repeat protein